MAAALGVGGILVAGPAVPASADVGVCGTLYVAVIGIGTSPLPGCTAPCTLSQGPNNQTGTVLVTGWWCVEGI
jgi:hypothetical protein